MPSGDSIAVDSDEEEVQRAIRGAHAACSRCCSSHSCCHVCTPAADADGSDVLHSGFNCDECGLDPIVGTRHHCRHCPDYDLCGDCYATREQFHAPQHSFSHVSVPSTQSQVGTQRSLQLPPAPPPPGVIPSSVRGERRRSPIRPMPASTAPPAALSAMPIAPNGHATATSPLSRPPPPPPAAHQQLGHPQAPATTARSAGGASAVGLGQGRVQSSMHGASATYRPPAAAAAAAAPVAAPVAATVTDPAMKERIARNRAAARERLLRLKLGRKPAAAAAATARAAASAPAAAAVGTRAPVPTAAAAAAAASTPAPAHGPRMAGPAVGPSAVPVAAAAPAVPAASHEHVVVAASKEINCPLAAALRMASLQTPLAGCRPQLQVRFMSLSSGSYLLSRRRVALRVPQARFIADMKTRGAAAPELMAAVTALAAMYAHVIVVVELDVGGRDIYVRCRSTIHLAPQLSLTHTNRWPVRSMTRQWPSSLGSQACEPCSARTHSPRPGSSRSFVGR